MEEILRLNDITMQFGGVVAVNGLSMVVNKGEIVALIGPNGAGKTTAFNAITGVYEPTNGEILFCGERVIENRPRGKMRRLYAGEDAGKYTHTIRKTPDRLTRLGMARTFQNIRLFKSMTVFENVLTAKHLRRRSNIFTATLHLNFREEAQMRRETLELLQLVGLEDERDELATSLPYGKQRKLEIARALATNMKLLLLDEPAAGMNPTETAELLSCINTIRDTFHVAILLIEHDMSLVMRVCERIQVINFGQTIAAGLPSEIASNQEVIEAYLGEEEADDDAED